jgi:aminoglycoside phosphotransferase (APT) family kinase protein
MPDDQRFRHVCVLLHERRVLTDDEGRVPSYVDHAWSGLARRTGTCGDPGAVLVAPQIEVGSSTLLSVFGSRSETPVYGTWRSLDQLVEDDPAVLTSLREIEAMAGGVIDPPARRPAWFRAGWHDEVDAWIDRELGARGRSRTGASVPVKVWSLSAVLRVPSDPEPVWFKASCRHFHAEPALTQLVVGMLPEHAPPVIAADVERAWLLIEDMAGADEDHEDAPPSGLGPAATRIAATLQLRSLDHLGEIEAAGVPLRGLAETLRGFDEVLDGSIELDALTPEELAAARGCRDEVHAVFGELAALEVPETLIHGDLHPGNVAHHHDALMFYDWSDATVSHPFLDVVHLLRSIPEDERDAAREAYADVWRAAYPDIDVDRGLELAAQVNAVFQMVTYEQICRTLEDASYWELSGVVARFLRDLPETFDGAKLPRTPRGTRTQER